MELLANQFTHPFLSLGVLATGVDSWNDKRHDEWVSE
jgi:hypothetical protein